MISRRRKPPVKKKEKVAIEDKKCKNCKFAYLMQSRPVNPVVCECTKTKERFVASTIHSEDCGFETNTESNIIHPMIFIEKR
jgi:hypothetical protein